MDPLEVLFGLCGAGGAITVVAKIGLERAKRKAPASLPPKIQPPIPPPSMSGQMRAMGEAMLKQTQEEALRIQVHEMHQILKERDLDGFPKVHNKRTVEEAILETRAHCERQVELLEGILEALQQPGPRPPTGYRKKLPSHRGGE